MNIRKQLVLLEPHLKKKFPYTKFRFTLVAEVALTHESRHCIIFFEEL